jgi:hypothetical protein
MGRRAGGYRNHVIHEGSTQMSDMWTYRDKAWSEGGEVIGYEVEATDGSIGKIDEATSETDASYVVVDTGRWIFGKKRLIPAGAVFSVDHDAQTVMVSLSKDQIKAAPDHEESKTWDDETRRAHTEYYGPFSRLRQSP